MTDKKVKDEKKPLRLSRPGKLELNKTVDAGKVQQSFSHGRSKSVTVEVRKKRTYQQGDGGRMTEIKGGPIELDIAKPAPKPVFKPAPVKSGAAGNLTNAEIAARARALEGAKQAAEEDAKRKVIEEAEAAKRAEEEAVRIAAEEAEAARIAAQEAEAAAKTEKAAPVAAEPAAAAPAPAPARAAAPKPAATKSAAARPAASKPAPSKPAAPKAAEVKKPANAPRRGAQGRRPGKMTITQALGGGRQERTRSLASVRRAREKEKQRARGGADQASKKQVREVIVPETITVQELANRMAERSSIVIKTLMQMGVMATINQIIDPDTAELVLNELGHTIKRVSDSDVEIGLAGADDIEADLQSRSPVVTVMGHVDHGKTSLLDALRRTDVVSGEAGGITQHIGAYQVTMESGQKISFIDTPGHAAFTAMRARGATVTDIVVLVVAADDGIMPQTIEAIHHARAAKAPIIVAINKMDKPDADPNRVRTDLLQHELVPEEMGGDVLCVEVSAKSGANLDKLEEAIMLQAEVMDLKANPNRSAEGVVVEAKMERGRGSVATVLIQRGTVRQGDIFVAGQEWGRVRALVDDHGNQSESAGPAVPVEVLGLQGTPSAGDDFVVVDSEARAREVADFRARRNRQAKAAAGARGSLEQMFSAIKAGEAKEFPVVVKGDVQGSVEAILGTIEKLGTDEVKVRVLHSAVGGVNESDVTLAQASNALIIGFNVRANPQARDLAKRDNVEIRYYSVIYDVIDDIKAALTGMLNPDIRENLLGYAEIREVFGVTKVGKVAGCRITEGMVRRGAKVRLLRDDVVIHEGSLSTLRRFKDEVKEVKEGYECGMSFENYQDIQAGDFIECFEVEEVARELD